jgi:hypothetical protein
MWMLKYIILIFALSVGTAYAQIPSSGSAVYNVKSGLCLDDPNNSKTNGVQVDQNTCNQGSGQTLTFKASGSNYYITNGLDGDCLDDYQAGTSAGTIVDYWPCLSGPPNNQLWTVSSSTGPGVFTIKSVNSGLCIQPSGSSTSTGVGIVQESCNGGNAENWIIAPVSVTQSGSCNCSNYLNYPGRACPC